MENSTASGLEFLLIIVDVASYYWLLVPELSCVAFVWTDDCQEAFEALKR